MHEPTATEVLSRVEAKRQQLRRRIALVLIAGLCGAVLFVGALGFRRMLQPCAVLDRALARSGCTQVISIPDFTIEQLTVAPQDDRIAVGGYSWERTAAQELLDPAQPQIRVFDLAEATQRSSVPLALENEPIPPLRFTADGQEVIVSDSLPAGVGFGAITLPDNTTRIAVANNDTETVLQVVHLPDERIVREIPLGMRLPLTNIPLYLAQDGTLLATQVATAADERRLIAWNVATGEQLLHVRITHFTSPVGAITWLGDSRQLAVGLYYHDSSDSGIALFAVP